MIPRTAKEVIANAPEHSLKLEDGGWLAIENDAAGVRENSDGMFLPFAYDEQDVLVLEAVRQTQAHYEPLVNALDDLIADCGIDGGSQCGVVLLKAREALATTDKPSHPGSHTSSQGSAPLEGDGEEGK